MALLKVVRQLCDTKSPGWEARVVASWQLSKQGIFWPKWRGSTLSGFLCKGYFEVTYKFKNGNFTFIIAYTSEYEYQSTIRVLNSWTRAIDNVVEELDYLVKTFNCYSEFHASSEAIIRQLPEKRLQSEISENLKTIRTGCDTWCCERCYFKKIGFHNGNRLRNWYTCQKIQTSETKLQFSQRCTVIKNLFSIEKYSVQNDTWSHALNVIAYM